MKMGQKDCKFEVVTPDRTFEFVAESEKEVLQWTAMIDVTNSFLIIFLIGCLS
jgi:hypothetical protein